MFSRKKRSGETSPVAAALSFDDHATPGVTVAVRLAGSEVTRGDKALQVREDVEEVEESVEVVEEEEVEMEEHGEVSGTQTLGKDEYRVYTSPPSARQDQLCPLDPYALDDPLDVVLTYCLDTVLSDEAKKHENWQERVQAMETLARLTVGGATGIPYFLQEMNASQHILESQMNDRRSAVSKQACVLVGLLAAKGGVGVKNLVLALQPTLLKLHGVSIAVMSQAAHECLDCVYEYCHDGRLLSHLCSVVCTDRNVKLRQGAVWQLLRVMECWEEGFIGQYRVDMEQTMMAAVVDASEGVRRVGRQLFEVYCVRFSSVSTFPGGRNESWATVLVDGIERGVWGKVDGATKKALLGIHRRIGEMQRERARAMEARTEKKVGMTPRRMFGDRGRIVSGGVSVADGPRRVLSVMKSGAGKAGRVPALEDERGYDGKGQSASAMKPCTNHAEKQSTRTMRTMRMSMGTGAMRVAAGAAAIPGAARTASKPTARTMGASSVNYSQTTAEMSVTSLIRSLYSPGRVWSDKVDCLRRLETVFLDDEIKEHISNESFDMLGDALVAEIGDAHYRVSCQAMVTLSAAFGCTAITTHLQHHMEQLVPVLFLRIGDTKECIRTAASEALLVLKEKNDLDLVLQGMVAATRTCKATKAQCAIMMYFEDVFEVHRGSSGNAWRTMLAYCLRMATNKNPDVREHAIAACARVYHSGKMAAVEAALSGLPVSPRATIKTALDGYGWDAAAEQSKSHSRLLSDALHYSETDDVSEDEEGVMNTMPSTVQTPVMTSMTTSSAGDSMDGTHSSVSFGDVCVESPNHAEYEEAIDDLDVAKRAHDQSQSSNITLQPLPANPFDEIAMMLSAPPNELFARLAGVQAHIVASISAEERVTLGAAVWDAFCGVILATGASNRATAGVSDPAPLVAACGGIISFFGLIPREKIEERIDVVLCRLLDLADGDDYELSTVAVAAGIQLVKAADPADAYSCLTPLLPSPSDMPPFRGPEARRLTNVLKLLRPCLRQVPRAQLLVALHVSLPSLCRCFESPHAEIRHLCLDCIVLIMVVVGEDAVAGFTGGMTKTQQQLLALHYAKQRRT